MCCLKRSDVAPGAYVSNHATGGLFRIVRVPSTNGRTQVALEDATSPLTSERLPDPDVPGRLGASMVLEPYVRVVPLTVAQQGFDLVVGAPSPEETASVEEWGPCGTT